MATAQNMLFLGKYGFKCAYLANVNLGRTGSALPPGIYTCNVWDCNLTIVILVLCTHSYQLIFLKLTNNWEILLPAFAIINAVQ